jgi:hypothetical protein
MFVSREFFNRFKAKLTTPFNLLSSPFSKKLLYTGGAGFYAFFLDIAWLRFYWLGLVLLATCFVLRAPVGWFIIPGIMTLMYVFWSPSLYLLLFKLGLRKAGFKGKVKRLGVEAFCDGALLWDK